MTRRQDSRLGHTGASIAGPRPSPDTNEPHRDAHRPDSGPQTPRSPARGDVTRLREAAFERLAHGALGLNTALVGERNFLVEGLSGTGKTSVCRELKQRGYQAINGDRELAYQGDPETGEATETTQHENHIWDVRRVRDLVSDRQPPVTFFCGGSRNFSKFIALFDEVFVLDIDLETLHRRLDQRPDDEWGSKLSERELIVRLHRTKEDIPDNGVVIDATRPLADVVGEILRHVGLPDAVRGDA